MIRLSITFALLAFLLAGQASAATYYVSATGDGNDANSGTSPSTPWATLTKVNNTAFSPGDIINFKRGSTWTGRLVVDSNGVPGHPVTYQAYGTGAAPIIQRSATPPTSGYTHAIDITGDYNVVGDFLVRHAHEAGIFLSSAATHNTVQGNEIMAAGTGVMVSGQFNLITENYVHDLRMIVNTSGGDDDYGAVCFWLQAPNNEVSYNRGVNCKASSFDYGSDGGFVEVWQNGDNSYVHHNYAKNTNGFFEVGGRNGTARNMRVAYNILDGTGSSMCLQIGTQFNVVVDNLRFEHNTVANGSGRFSCISGSIPASTLIVRNNIFPAGSVYSGNFTHSHNLYRSSPGSLGPGEKVGDPRFVNPSAEDFHLQAGSPAIDAGLDLGYTEDFEDNPVPQGAAPDMGAFEFGSTGGGGGAVTSVNDNAFSYSGSWSLATGAGKYLDDDHYTNSTNAFYTYTFTGTKAQVFAATAPWHGRAGISVDGGLETLVDLYSPTKVNQVPIYTSPSLPTGTHTVKVRCAGTHNPSSTGNYITADRIDITN